MLDYAWIIPLIPAASFFLILFFGKRMPRKGSEIGIAAVGLALCPFTMASATVLFYMLREDARLYFSGRPVPGRSEAARATELTFSLSLLAMVVLGALLTALSAWLSGGRAPAS